MTYGDKPATAPQEAGYLTEVSTGEGGDQRVVKLTPDEAGRVEERATNYGTASKTTYDEWDRVIRSVTGIGGGVFADVSATTELAYDERGRLIHQRQKQHGLASGGGWAETDITYNERDQVLTVKENGLASEVRGGALTEGTTINTYLNSGLLDTVKSPGGVTVKYEYGAGRVSSVSRVGVEGTRHVAYDAMGRVVFTSDGDEGVWRGRYDAWGRLYEEELPTGTVIRRSFDRAGGLVREQILWPESGDPPEHRPSRQQIMMSTVSVRSRRSLSTSARNSGSQNKNSITVAGQPLRSVALSNRDTVRSLRLSTSTIRADGCYGDRTLSGTRSHMCTRVQRPGPTKSFPRRWRLMARRHLQF